MTELAAGRFHSRWLPAAAQTAAVLLIAYVAIGIALRQPWANDAAGIYRSVRGDLYGTPWLERGAYVYSPAFAQAIGPLALLPYRVFWAAWVTAQVIILVAVARPIPAALVLILPWFPLQGYPNPVQATITNGNPQLFIAGALVLAHRQPAAWLVPLLMKVTPGIGLVWYVARRAWRELAIALVATSVVVAVSFLSWPTAWGHWLALLGQAAGADTSRVELIYVPLAVRLPVAALLIIWGARKDRYWTVPVGAVLALPAIAYGGLAVGVAMLPFIRPAIDRWAATASRAVAKRRRTMVSES